MKFYIKTLGCKMNWLDSARLRTALALAGHEETGDEQQADYLFVNTCTVTAEADRKSRQAANSGNRLSIPVAVMGCSPRADREKWQDEQGRMVFSDEQTLYRHFDIDPETLPTPGGARTRLPIAIQRGCDNQCGFCITRIARGAHQNIPAEAIIEQIRTAGEMGINEVVLTGINLAAWGCEDTNRPEQARLGELVEAILRQTSMPRIRFSSLGPEYLNDGFIDLLSDERLCDYFHLSVQSGSDAVLQRMERGHGTAEIVRFAEQARRLRPHLALAADIITGYPGESDSEHKDGLALLESLRFAKLHVFPFSPREGTPAAHLGGQLPKELKKERATEVRELGKRLRREFIDSQMGRELEVLVEGRGTGLSGNYIRIRSDGADEGSIIYTTLSPDNLSE